MDYPLDRPVQNIVVRSIATDGGTAYVEAVVDGVDGYQFYIDGRTNSQTRGELFREYPGNADSAMIEPTSVFSKTAKQMWLDRGVDGLQSNGR